MRRGAPSRRRLLALSLPMRRPCCGQRKPRSTNMSSAVRCCTNFSVRSIPGAGEHKAAANFLGAVHFAVNRHLAEGKSAAAAEWRAAAGRARPRRNRAPACSGVCLKSLSAVVMGFARRDADLELDTKSAFSRLVAF